MVDAFNLRLTRTTNKELTYTSILASKSFESMGDQHPLGAQSCQLVSSGLKFLSLPWHCVPNHQFGSVTLQELVQFARNSGVGSRREPRLRRGQQSFEQLITTSFFLAMQVGILASSTSRKHPLGTGLVATDDGNSYRTFVKRNLRGERVPNVVATNDLQRQGFRVSGIIRYLCNWSTINNRFYFAC